MPTSSALPPPDSGECTAHEPRPSRWHWRPSAIQIAPCILILALVGTAAFDVRAWTEAELPAFSEDTSFLDGGTARAGEDWLRKASFVRRHVAPLWARGLLEVFGRANEIAVMGEDNWWFLASRLKVPPKISPAQTRATARLLAELQRRFASLGIDLELMIVPRKGLICEAFLGEHHLGQPLLYGWLLDALEEEGFPAADLATALSAHPPERVWHAAGSHWTDFGLATAVETVTRRLWPGDVPRPRSNTTVRWVLPAMEERDTLRALGLMVADEHSGHLSDDGPPALHVLRETGARITGRESWDRKVGQVWWAGTSFTASRPAAPLLEHLSGRTVRNFARPALGPFQPMHHLLTALKTAPAAQRPQAVVWEIPSYHLFAEGMGGEQAILDLLTLHGDAPFGAHEGLGSLDNEATAQHLGARTSNRVLRIEGRWIHDGSAGVQLAFTQPAGVALRLECDVWTRHLQLPAPKEATERVIPLVATSPIRSLALRALGGGRITPSSIRLLCARDLRTTTASAAATRVPAPSDAGRVSEYRFDAPQEITPGAMVFLAAEPEATVAQCSLFGMEVLTDSGWRWLRGESDPRLTSQHLLTLSLNGLQGEHVSALRVHWHGPKHGLDPLRALIAP